MFLYFILFSVSCNKKNGSRISPPNASNATDATQETGSTGNQQKEETSGEQQDKNIGNEEVDSSVTPIPQDEEVVAVPAVEPADDSTEIAEIKLINFPSISYNLPSGSEMGVFKAYAADGTEIEENISFMILGGTNIDYFTLEEDARLLAAKDINGGSQFFLKVKAEYDGKSTEAELQLSIFSGLSSRELLATSELGGTIIVGDANPIDRSQELTFNPGSSLKIPVFSDDGHILNFQCIEGLINVTSDTASYDYTCANFDVSVELKGEFVTVTNNSDAPTIIHMNYFKPIDNQKGRNFNEEELFDSRGINPNIYIDVGEPKTVEEVDGNHIINIGPQSVGYADTVIDNYNYILDFLCTGRITINTQEFACKDNETVRTFTYGRYIDIRNDTDAPSSLINLKISLMLNTVATTTSQQIASDSDNAALETLLDGDGNIRVEDTLVINSGSTQNFNAVKIECKSGNIDVDRYGNSGFIGQLACPAELAWTKILPLESNQLNGVWLYRGGGEAYIKSFTFLKAN